MVSSESHDVCMYVAYVYDVCMYVAYVYTYDDDDVFYCSFRNKN